MKPSKTTGYPLHDYYSRIFRKYDLVNRLFTFGKDRRWRRITATKCLEFDPETVIDLCCGTGDLSIMIRELSLGKLSITGFDFNAKMLDVARKKAEKKQIHSIEFVQGDVASMPFDNETFDCMTIGFGFRNLSFNNTHIAQHMHEICRILKPGGNVLILESSVPANFMIRFFYRIYLKIFLVPLGGLISGSWKAYSYLAGSSANFYSISELKELMGEYGFTILSVQPFFLGSVNLIIARKE